MKFIGNTKIYIGQIVAICYDGEPHGLAEVVSGTDKSINVRADESHGCRELKDFVLDEKSRVYVNMERKMFLYFFGDMPFHFD